MCNIFLQYKNELKKKVKYLKRKKSKTKIQFSKSKSLLQNNPQN